MKMNLMKYPLIFQKSTSKNSLKALNIQKFHSELRPHGKNGLLYATKAITLSYPPSKIPPAIPIGNNDILTFTSNSLYTVDNESHRLDGCN